MKPVAGLFPASSEYPHNTVSAGGHRVGKSMDEPQTIERFNPGDLLARAANWASMAPDELRRNAVTAANQRDEQQLWDLTEAFLAVRGAKGTRVSGYTLRNYRKGVFDLVEAWPHVNLLRPGRDDALLWVRSLEQHMKPGTVRNRVASARSLYKALRWARATDADPFVDVKAPRDPVSRWEKRGHYTMEHIAALLRLGDATDRAIVLLGAHAALRISEVVSLRWRDVDLDTGVATVTGKGGKTASVLLNSQVVDALRDLPAGAPDAKVIPWQVDYTRERFQRLCRKAGVPYKGRAFHGLRHAAGTRLYEVTGGDLGMVAEHLRHSDIETTRTYAKRQTKRTRAALELM